jgi:hypothetical protein
VDNASTAGSPSLSLAMAYRRNPELAQILSCQPAQHLLVNVVVAERGRVLLEPEAAQPSHYVHAVILGSEERQPLVKEDIPLPFGLPASALAYAPCRVSRLQAVTAFKTRASQAGHIGNVAFPPK